MNNGVAVIETEGLPEEWAVNTSAAEEAALLERIRQGNTAAFDKLVRDHLPRVVNLAYRLLGDRNEAEDIAQEAFLRLHRSLPNFRGECLVMTWLYRVVSRLVVDHLRRERLRRRLFFFRRDEEDPDPVDTFADTAPSPRDQLLARETEKRLFMSPSASCRPASGRYLSCGIRKACLSARSATCWVLREGTIKAHLHRAVQVLRKELNDWQEDTP
jgi:RNA polymerase sigma-70 factor, ECF subfamily